MGFAASSRSKRVLPSLSLGRAATARGLDFIAVTDHNTQSYYDEERELQPYFDKILLMPAREITTYQGHANVFGTTDFLDFRIGTGEVPDLNTMLRHAQGLGATISINHPSVVGGENCMGCAWQADEKTDYRLIQAVEIVNGSEADGTKSGVAFWEALLNRGFHLTAGTYILRGKKSGMASVTLEDAPDHRATRSVSVQYENCSDDAQNFYNGTESVADVIPTPTSVDLDWHSNISQSGKTRGEKVTSPDGFRLKIDFMKNIFEATGTLTTTVKGVTYVSRQMGTRIKESDIPPNR